MKQSLNISSAQLQQCMFQHRNRRMGCNTGSGGHCQFIQYR